MKIMKTNEKKLGVYRYPIFRIFHIPLSPLNPKDTMGTIYDKSCKIKVLRDFFLSLSDIRKTRKRPVRTAFRY